MNDTVTKILALADDYADVSVGYEECRATQDDLDAARQALQDELTRLFTPLRGSEAVYRCRGCGHIYQEEMSSCDCTVSEPPNMETGVAVFPWHGITGEKT